MKEAINKPIKIYMHNGVVFRGILKAWEDSFVEVLSIDGETIKIFSTQYIDAISYHCENEKVKKELTPTEPKSLVELRKLKAEQEIEEVRRKLRSSTTVEPVQYGSVLSVIKKKC